MKKPLRGYYPAQMASYQDREVDRLVELIADRVRDRIGRGAMPVLSVRDRGPCVDDESEAVNEPEIDNFAEAAGDEGEE